MNVCSTILLHVLCSPPPYRADASVSMMDLREKYALPVHKRRDPTHAASTGDILDDIHREEPQEAYVLGKQWKLEGGVEWIAMCGW